MIEPARLGALLPEGEEEQRRVETCESCNGYIKTLTTLQPIPPWAILLYDLENLDLELTAVERGFQRPERPGYVLAARITGVAFGGLSVFRLG